MNTTAEAFPLSWPPGWPRTPAAKLKRAQFSVRVARGSGDVRYTAKSAVTLYVGRDRLFSELRRLGATDVVMSSNIPVRLDGLPYSSAREPKDHGVAVYFRIKGEPRVLACDKWDRCADNMAALAAHVEAIRGQIRWGVGSLEQAFGGYRALPAMPPVKRWFEVLGLPSTARVLDVEMKVIELLRIHHPDKGGSHARAAEINAAADEARAELYGAGA